MKSNTVIKVSSSSWRLSIVFKNWSLASRLKWIICLKCLDTLKFYEVKEMFIYLPDRRHCARGLFDLLPRRDLGSSCVGARRLEHRSQEAVWLVGRLWCRVVRCLGGWGSCVALVGDGWFPLVEDLVLVDDQAVRLLSALSHRSSFVSAQADGFSYPVLLLSSSRRLQPPRSRLLVRFVGGQWSWSRHHFLWTRPSLILCLCDRVLSG